MPRTPRDPHHPPYPSLSIRTPVARVRRLPPERAYGQVFASIDAEVDDVVPAARPIALEDRLSSRFGFGSVMAVPGAYPIQRAEAEAGLQSIGGPPWPPIKHDA